MEEAVEVHGRLAGEVVGPAGIRGQVVEVREPAAAGLVECHLEAGGAAHGDVAPDRGRGEGLAAGAGLRCAVGRERVGHGLVLGGHPGGRAWGVGDPGLVDEAGELASTGGHGVDADVEARAGSRRVGAARLHRAVEVDRPAGRPLHEGRVVPGVGQDRSRAVDVELRGGAGLQQVVVLHEELGVGEGKDVVLRAEGGVAVDPRFVGVRGGSGGDRARDVVVGTVEVERAPDPAGHLLCDGHPPGGRAVAGVGGAVPDLGRHAPWVLAEVPHAPVVRAPDRGRVLPVGGIDVAVVHPDEVGVRRSIHLRDADPHVGGTRLVPGLDLVGEDGGVVGVDEPDVLSGVLGAEVLDARAVQPDQDREVDEVLGLCGVVERDLDPDAPGVVPPREERRGRSDGQHRTDETRRKGSSSGHRHVTLSARLIGSSSPGRRGAGRR